MTVSGKLLCQGKAARKQELEPDLVDTDAVAEPIDKRARLLDARHVERDDEPAACLSHAWRSGIVMGTCLFVPPQTGGRFDRGCADIRTNRYRDRHNHRKGTSRYKTIGRP